MTTQKTKSDGPAVLSSVELGDTANAEANGSRNETRNPCVVCGWAKHMAIHTAVIVVGPRAGQLWGHAYEGREAHNA